ncbi:MAG: sulfatase [Phycisphaerae bacterium]
MRSRLPILGVSLAGLLVAPGMAIAEEPNSADRSRRPNIVVIVADDLGYADLGCQGSLDIPTPNIDSLAKNGIRMNNGYVSCPVCSPTRAGLVTGRYQQRFGHEFNPGPPDRAADDFGLPLDEVTLANRLKAAGYATGMVGKWHLGLKERFHPLKRGFTDYFGFLHGGHSYTDALGDPLNPIMRGFTPVDEQEYLSDAFSREAVAYIDRHAKEPFFLYLTYNAVHTPLQAPEKYLKRFPRIEDPKRRTYAAMLSAMDDGVGAVLARLREAGIEENTLIFFLSDNGGPSLSNGSRNTPLRGNKSDMWEGGIRVPFIVQWKGKLPAGRVYDQPVISLDIHPTAVAAAGAALAKDADLDGVNLLPYLTGDKDAPPHETLYWRFGAKAAVRDGNWKLVMLGDEPGQLFDLAADVGEQKNLAADHPDKVKELTAAYDRWSSQLMEPRWSQAGRGVAPARPARPRRGNR